MFDFANIIRDDRETYRNFETDLPTPYWRPKLVRLFCATILAIFFYDINTEFLTALISAYSILLGFGFSVLFNLSNNSLVETTEKFDSIEDELTAKKIKIVRNQLFKNVSMFVSVSIMILTGILIFMVLGNAEKFVCEKFNNLLNSNVYFSCVFRATRLAFVSGLYFLILESFVSFMRVVERVNYTFRNKFSSTE